MERMRTLLQKELWASLRSLPEDDMFALAWQLACGSTMARRGEVVRYEKGVVHVIVADPGWERQMRSMSGVLQRRTGSYHEEACHGDPL